MNAPVKLDPAADARRRANAIRFLAIDAVEAAKSGHPGAPMGMADIAEVLWRKVMKHNPADPKWYDRDRFVLSNGHGSMLLYALLNLTGYDLPMEELKRFRQMHSMTPGHPEWGVTPGVETTTGPLGQGLANAVGMALAESLLAQEFNRDGHDIVNHRTFAFCGDGCLMEGISHESCSLAGTLGLGKLILVYDDNGISIDGKVAGWFADDTPKRFEAYGWRVIRNVDGNDSVAVEKALKKAIRSDGRPTLICAKTTIGWGSPHKAGSHDVHGAPLGAAETAATRAALGWTSPPFVIPEDIRAAWDMKAAGKRAQNKWKKAFKAYRAAHPALAAEYERRMKGELPAVFKATADKMLADAARVTEPLATRKTSQMSIDALAPVLPEFLGGSADLTGSNFTNAKGVVPVRHGKPGNYINYGVREFGMAAIINGIVLHGGYIPFGGTFLVFADYSRNALRLAALMGIRAIHVLTHDSIGVGEDGPTHQPVEHVVSLQIIPNMDVWRPCDNLETAVAWKAAVERVNGPTALILTRQNLPQQGGGVARADSIAKGGYVLLEAEGSKPDLILIATGSEVALARQAAGLLAGQGRKVRVVSMPSANVFDRQTAAWRASVLPKGVKRCAIEAGATDRWWKYVGLDGAVVGMTSFGESAPAGELFKHFGFTPEHVAEVAGKL